MTSRRWMAALTLVAAAIGCSSGAPDTPEARRARGIDLLNQSGRTVASAQSFSFTTHEEGERVRRSGAKDPVTIDQVLQVRRPDKLHLKATGGRDLELIYDGKQMTLMTHTDKVYGVVPATGSLTEVLPDASDRYDIPFPLGDLIAFTSADRIVNEETTGGWVGEETIDGQPVTKLTWEHPNLDWSVWLANDERRLPVRLELHYKARRGSPRRTYTFTGWQFDADLPESVFAANVPADYEGIPVIQRASVVLDAQAENAPASEKEQE